MERAGKEELFVLKWDNFRSNISNNFSSLRHNSEFQDITLYIDKEHSVSAHKVILASSSSYFQSLLSGLPPASSSNPILIMPQGLTHNELVYMLDYMYHGEVSLPESELERFMDLAEQFQVRGLKKDTATPSNVRSRVQKGQDPPRARRPSQPMKSVGLLCPNCSVMCKDVAALKAHMTHECAARQENDLSTHRPIGSVGPQPRPVGSSVQEKNRPRVPMSSKFPSGGASRQHHNVPRRGLEIPSTRPGAVPYRYSPVSAPTPPASTPPTRHSPAPTTAPITAPITNPSPVPPTAEKRRRPVHGQGQGQGHGHGQDLASNLVQRFGGGISVSAVSSGQKKARVEPVETEGEVDVGDVKLEPKDYYEEADKDFGTVEDEEDMMDHEEEEYYPEDGVDEAAYVEGDDDQDEQDLDHETGFPGYDYYGHE